MLHIYCTEKVAKYSRICTWSTQVGQRVGPLLLTQLRAQARRRLLCQRSGPTRTPQNGGEAAR
jgi:hypothetical protein